MDAYRLLGLAPGASLDDVRMAYHRLAVRHHPDQHPVTERDDAERRMMLINEARAQVLRDIQARAARPAAVRVPQQRTGHEQTHEQTRRAARAYVETELLVPATPAPATVEPTNGRWRDAVVPGLLAVVAGLGLVLGLPIPALLALLGLLVVASVMALF